MTPTLYLLSPPRIAGLLLAQVPSSSSAMEGKNTLACENKTPIQTDLRRAIDQLTQAVIAFVNGHQSDPDFIRAETSFLVQIQALKTGQQSIISNAQFNKGHLGTARTLLTPDEVEMDINRTLQRCRDHFQDAKYSQPVLMKELHP